MYNSIFSTGKGLKQGIMNTDSTVNQYFSKVFCGGWDFCISDQKAALKKHKNILQELEVLYVHVTNYNLVSKA